MNSSNNSFFLIPLFILAFVAIAFTEKSKEEVAEPNAVKHDEKENKSKPDLKVEIPPHPKSHGLPVRSPQESPSKNWKKPPTSPRSGRGGNNAPKRKPLAFSKMPSLPEMETADSLKTVPENGELPPDDFVGGFHHIPTLRTVAHELNKQDSMIKSHQDQIGAISRLATGVRDTVVKYQATNLANHEGLRMFSQQIANNVAETQNSMGKFYKEYGKTADSHDALKEKYENFVLADKEAKEGIQSKLETHGTGISTLQNELGTERGRIDAAVKKHDELQKVHDELSTHVKNVVNTKLNTHEEKFKENGEEMAKLVEEDKLLGNKIKDVENAHNTFKDTTFAEHVKGMDGKFTKAHDRMDGFDTRANGLENMQKGHGEDIKYLQLENDKQWMTASKHFQKIKKRKEENGNIRTKLMNMPTFLNELFARETIIDNRMMDLGEELPKILVEGQKTVNEAQKALLEANKKAAEEAQKNQEKVLKANEELVEANEEYEMKIEEFINLFNQVRSGFISRKQNEQEAMLKAKMEEVKKEEEERQAQSVARKEARKAAMDAAPAA